MYVSEILNKKGSGVFTLRPEIGVERAIGLFMERKVGSFPICDASGKILGILTERDILHGAARHGPAVFELKVEDLMSRKVHTCTPDDDVKRVMAIMTNERVRHVPVVVRGELKGMISIGDIIKNRLEAAELEVSVLRDYARIR